MVSDQDHAAAVDALSVEIERLHTLRAEALEMARFYGSAWRLIRGEPVASEPSAALEADQGARARAFIAKHGGGDG